MATLERAVEIAARAHAGAKDKQGEPYLLHPLRVMFGVEGDETRIVGVLHDVIEDTSVTLDDIRAAGFSAAVVEALDLVTHRREQPYADYVVACRGNSIARQVKLSDLRDNSALNRLLLRPQRFHSDSKRLHRYLLSYRFLTEQIDEAAYRSLMADFK